MEQLFLMPGQERCERFKDANGAPRVHYSYCSMRGAARCAVLSLIVKAAVWKKRSACARTGWSVRIAVIAIEFRNF